MIAAAVRGRMTMRATVERNVQTAEDPYGGRAQPPKMAHVDVVPCYAWSSRRFMSRVLAFSDLRAIRIQELQIAFPLESRPREDDVVQQVTDRRGKVLWQGPFVLKTMQRKRGYKAALLEQVGS